MPESESNGYTALTEEQGEFFENNGYLVVKNALPKDFVADLDTAVDEVYAREVAEGKIEAGGKLNIRNCVLEHKAFFKLLDWPATVGLAWGILNWNIQMNTSNLIVVPPEEGPAPHPQIVDGLHRDGGLSHMDMQEPHPRILLKIAYAISDQSDPATGATRVVPGSNRLIGKIPVDPENNTAFGTIAMNVKAGDAFIFEQRTWHGIGRNSSDIARKTIFMGYAYRWVKPMDYISMPENVLAKCTPIQKQLLGVVEDALSYYLPPDEDVPVKALVEDS